MAGNEVSEAKRRYQSRLDKRLRIGMYLGLVCGPIVFGVGVRDYRRVKGLKSNGVTVEATVVALQKTGGGQRNHLVSDVPAERKMVPGENL